MVIKRNTLLVLLLCFAGLMTAQSTIDSDVFIQSTVQKLQTTQGFNVDKVRFPWVEEIQFRTETRDMDFQQQEYTLRISPSTIGKVKAQKALLHHYQNPPNVDQAKNYEQTIRTIYADWLTLYFIDQELLILDTLKTIWSDKKKVNDKLLASYAINVKSMVNLEIEKSNLSQSRFELGMEQDLLHEIHSLEDKTLDYSQMITLEDVEQKLSEMILLTNSESNIDDELEYQYELEGIQKEITLEKAEDKQIFDFAQARYRGPHADIWEEKIAFGIGFKLPRSGNRKLKIAELMLDQQSLEAEHKLDQTENNLDIAELVSELKYKLAQAKHFSQVIADEKVELTKLAKVVQRKEGYDPLTLLDIKENALARQTKMLEYRQDIYVDYIKLLGMLGKLSESPFINYLKA